MNDKTKAVEEGESDLDTTHLPESINEPPGSDVLVGAEDGENVQAAKAVESGGPAVGFVLHRPDDDDNDKPKKKGKR